jgi:hypothetical protein
MLLLVSWHDDLAPATSSRWGVSTSRLHTGKRRAISWAEMIVASSRVTAWEGVAVVQFQKMLKYVPLISFSMKCLSYNMLIRAKSSCYVSSRSIFEVDESKWQENGLILVRIEAYKLVEHWLINHLWRELTRKTCVDISWFWKKMYTIFSGVFRLSTHLGRCGDLTAPLLPTPAATAASFGVGSSGPPSPLLRGHFHLSLSNSLPSQGAGKRQSRGPHATGALPHLDFLEMGASGEVA